MLWTVSVIYLYIVLIDSSIPVLSVCICLFEFDYIQKVFSRRFENPHNNDIE